ncbi:hypothetical protein Tco_1089531 [Tanacetum coccineum]
MHTRASNSELVEPLPEPEHTLNRRLRRRNRRVPYDQRNNPPQHPRIIYPPILNINYFRHFLEILQNYDPMDDEPMWAADHVVAPTPGSAITIPGTTNEFAIKGSSKSNTDKIMARMDAMTLKMDAQYKELQNHAKKQNQMKIIYLYPKRKNTDDKPYDLQKQFNDFMKSQQSTNAFVKETFMDLKTQLETVAKNHQASIQNLKTKFDRLTDNQSGRPSGSLPSNIQPNPKGHNSKAYQPPQSRNKHMNVVFTRSGKSYNLSVNLNDQQNDSETLINFDSNDEDEESTPQPKT